MDLVRSFYPVAFLITLIGALNWGILGLFDTNVLAEVFGTGTLLDVVYVIVGVAALMLVPRLMDELHIGGDHRAHPRGV